MSHRHRLASLVLVAQIVAPPSVLADDYRGGDSRASASDAMLPQPQRHFEAGLRAYRRGQFAVAIQELDSGYAAQPHPDFLFPLAQSLRRAGDCGRAVAVYRQVLATDLPDHERASVEQLIARCPQGKARSPAIDSKSTAGAIEAEPVARAALAGESQTSAHLMVGADEGAAAPAQTVSFPVHSRDRHESRRWYHDPAGWILLSSGVVAAGVGTGLLIASNNRSESSDLPDLLGDLVEEELGEPVSQPEPSSNLTTAGYIGLGAGGVLVAASVIRFAVVGADRSSRPSVSLVPGASGANLVWTGRF